MSEVDEYRALAERCLRQAALAHNECVAQTLREMAADYLERAALAEPSPVMPDDRKPSL